MVMRSLPEHVDDAEIEEMFNFADKDGDGLLSYEEFQVVCHIVIAKIFFRQLFLDHGQPT